jgi:hypothetical protein
MSTQSNLHLPPRFPSLWDSAHSMKDTAQVTAPGATIKMIATAISRPITRSPMPLPIALVPRPSCEPVHGALCVSASHASSSSRTCVRQLTQLLRKIPRRPPKPGLNRGRVQRRGAPLRRGARHPRRTTCCPVPPKVMRLGGFSADGAVMRLGIRNNTISRCLRPIREQRFRSNRDSA